MTSEQSESDIVRWEIDYRRQKQWNIFSWCSTLLVAIIGGTITLRTGFFAKPPMTWTTYLQSVITVAVLVLVVYSCSWIHHSDHREMIALSRLLEADDWLKYKRHWGWSYSSRVVVVLLGLAAILAIWIPLWKE